MNKTVHPAVTNTHTQAASSLTHRSNPRWEAVAELLAAGTTVAVTVSIIRLNVRLQGLHGYLPGSQLPRHERSVDLTGQQIGVKIIECDPNSRHSELVVSRLAAPTDERNRLV